MEKQIITPDFKHQEIHRRKDGYWIEKFYYHKDDKAPGLIVWECIDLFVLGWNKLPEINVID